MNHKSLLRWNKEGGGVDEPSRNRIKGEGSDGLMERRRAQTTRKRVSAGLLLLPPPPLC